MVVVALLFRSNELPCGLSLCTSSCSLVVPRENKIACVSTNVLTPSWLYTRCLRVSVCTWTQVPMPRFSATDVLLTKYIWIWFLSGFSCPSQKLLKCSAAETLCGTVKAWRLYRALFFCEDVTFLTRVVVRLRLQQKCSSFLQTRYAGTHPCAGTLVTGCQFSVMLHHQCCVCNTCSTCGTNIFWHVFKTHWA